MAHPNNVAEASEAPANSGNAIEDFADFLEGTGELDEEEEVSPEEGDTPEDESEGETAEDEGEEPAGPAIDPPVSWAADAKELFSQLPPELQQQVAERETQRERFIQQKASEASEAKRTAAMEAERATAELQRQYATQLEQYASLLEPQRPDPALLRQDPVAFYQLQAEYEAGIAQRQQMMQRATLAQQEAMARQQQAEALQTQAEVAKLAQAIPEWADPAKRAALLTEYESVGAELGYGSELMAQATADDILALRKAAEWKSKAAKYDALQKTKMEVVRSAKALPKVSKPGVAPTRGEISQSRAQAAWQNVKAAKSKDAQAEAFAGYLENSGHL